MAALVFIDTNIYLDFYRVRGSDASLSILGHIDANHDSIISTTQVEMEYKKNRQRVILDSWKLIAKPSGELVIPAFLKESQLSKSIKSTQKKLSGQTDKLRKRTARLLSDPGLNDPVYKSLQRLFRARASCHFHRGVDKKLKHQIWERAQRRFTLGYPPRKNDDTSIGDAINWEWIIACAQQCTDDIIIVSRDSDFGIQYQGESILNDWLRQEFKERVKSNRSIYLTERLTEAFKRASIAVTREEEESERQLLQTIKAAIPAPSQVSLYPPFGASEDSFTPIFVWGPVEGATGYEFVIAEESGEQDPFAVILYTAITPVNGHVCREALKHSSTYNWRVRALVGSDAGAWTTSFFTTTSAPLSA